MALNFGVSFVEFDNGLEVNVVTTGAEETLQDGLLKCGVDSSHRNSRRIKPSHKNHKPTSNIFPLQSRPSQAHPLQYLSLPSLKRTMQCVYMYSRP